MDRDETFSPRPRRAIRKGPPKRNSQEDESGRGPTPGGLIRFRVIDDDTAQPISLARIVIDNGNLAPDLGQDSDAVTWPDGRAIIVHQFLFWEERRGEEKPKGRILQGPWIHATADGYEPKKMPLSDLLEQMGRPSVPDPREGTSAFL